MASSVLEDQAFVDKTKQQAASIYDPQRDLALNAIDQSNAGLNINQTDIGRQYDTLGQTLKDQANQSNNYLDSRSAQLGMLRDGSQAVGMGDIQKKLNTNLGNAEQDRASRLAQLALQRAGLTTQRAQVQGTYTNSLNDYVAKLLDNEQQRRDAAEAAAEAKRKSAASNSYNDELNKMLMKAMYGDQSQQDQQQPQYDPNEDLDAILGNGPAAEPTNPNPQNLPTYGPSRPTNPTNIYGPANPTYGPVNPSNPISQNKSIKSLFGFK